jgi:MSHA biogenesis protein MshG
MAYYAYKGRNARGELVQGTLESSDTGAVADQLLNTGISPIDISPTRAPRISGETKLFKWFTEDRIRLNDLLLFSRQMYTLLKAGIPILRSLAGLQESTFNRTLSAILKNLRESLDSGRELSVAMRQHPKVFSPFYVSMVRVGEITGKLEEVFLRLFYYLDFEKDIKEKIRSALMYPSFVVIAIVFAVVVINIVVIPKFAEIYERFNAPLPYLTQVLIGISNFMVHYWPLLLVLTVGTVFGVRQYLLTSTGRYNWDKKKLNLPVAGEIILKATMARFARSFSIAMKSGIPIVQALSVVAQVVDNAYIGQRIEQMRDGVERGESVSRTAATTAIFTPMVLQMIAVGEETGELDNLMGEVAEMYEREVEYQVKNLSTQIEPILIVGLGVIVLFLALGMFLPMWDLGQVALSRNRV